MKLYELGLKSLDVCLHHSVVVLESGDLRLPESKLFPSVSKSISEGVVLEFCDLRF